jgi:hypothetical protein
MELLYQILSCQIVNAIKQIKLLEEIIVIFHFVIMIALITVIVKRTVSVNVNNTTQGPTVV